MWFTIQNSMSEPTMREKVESVITPKDVEDVHAPTDSAHGLKNRHATIMEVGWWVGVTLIAGLVAVFPYWTLNLLNLHVLRAPWWRVPVVTPGLFDTYVYLHWIGASAEGLMHGEVLGWFGTVLRVLWMGMRGWASVPELWIVSRWITVALSLLIGAWSVRCWSGLDRWSSRAVAGGLWLSAILTLSQRPGIYSWYLPFFLIGLTCILFVKRALDKSNIVPAIAWSALSVALSSTYPWFLMTSVLWIAVIWGAWLLLEYRRVLFSLLVLFAGAVFVSAIPLAHWFLDPAQAGLLGVYERNGIVFARVPFFANTVIAILAWIALLYAAVRRMPQSDVRDLLIVEAGGWIMLFLFWFNTPVTGIHLYSDHIIAPVMVLAWLCLATVWAAARERGHGLGSVRRAGAWEKFVGFLPLMIAGGATLFFFYILQQPLRFNMKKFDSYVVHLSHWFALAVAGWIVVWRSKRPNAELNSRVVSATILIPAFLIGVTGVVPVIVRDAAKVPSIVANQPIVDWIRSNVPVREMMCSDIDSAQFYAAHTGRRVNPAEATLSYPESSDRVIANLATFVGAYNVSSSGSLPMMRFYTDHYRTIPCAAASKYSHNAFHANVLAYLGFSEQRVNELIGCRQDVIDANWKRVETAMERYTIDVPVFRSFCPWVIIPDAQKPYWQLPSDYREYRLENGTSIWRTP
jgi:hypothetical protein